MEIEELAAAIAERYAGRRWIVPADVAAGATALVAYLRECGVDAVMVVAGTEGIGELPAADVTFVTASRGDTMMTAIRAFLTAVEDPSDELRAAVDAFDPSGAAMVLGGGFSRRDRLLGRPVYGARLAAWGALEDKTIIDELWDAAGVPRAPSRVVPVAEAAAVAPAMASDLGSVWVADNTEGWHGGGEYLRWVREPADVDEATTFFARRARRVRVMPFLDGIPCSIHGFVADDGVAVFRPVEMLILRRTDRSGLLYGRAATFWEPTADVAAEMREAARRVGTELRRRVAYRGSFGIDGIATIDGFRPTELNPRASVGHFLQAQAAGLPYGSMERCFLAGDLDVDVRWLAETVTAAAAEHRSGVSFVPIEGRYDETTVGVRFSDEGAAAVELGGGGDEPAVDATMRIGPSAFGSVLMVRFDPDRTPVGPSTAPRALAAIDLARELWNVDIPPVAASPDVLARNDPSGQVEVDGDALAG